MRRRHWNSRKFRNSGLELPDFLLGPRGVSPIESSLASALPPETLRTPTGRCLALISEVCASRMRPGPLGLDDPVVASACRGVEVVVEVVLVELHDLGERIPMGDVVLPELELGDVVLVPLAEPSALVAD